MSLLLTPAETAYVRRFCYEVATNQFGPGSIFDYCRDHCRDLETLAMETNLQGEILDDHVNGRSGPEPAPFPWQSFEDLHRRAAESQLIHS